MNTKLAIAAWFADIELAAECFVVRLSGDLRWFDGVVATSWDV